MNGGGLSHHPARHADKLSSAMAAFMLLTPPLAWLVQLCIGAAATSWSCFPRDIRLMAPMPGYRLTALLVLLGCALLSAISTIVSLRKLAEVKDEEHGSHRRLADRGMGRTRFIALWGVILGVSFTVATLLHLAAFVLVPPCVG